MPVYRASPTADIGRAEMTNVIMNGTTALTPKHAIVMIAASTTDGPFVTAVGGKKIRIVLFRLHTGASATSVTFNRKPAGAGVAISETFALGANGGHSPGFCAQGHFADTGVGEGITVTTGAGSTTGVGIVYLEV